MLTDFKDKDMIEQITLLTTIQENTDVTALPQLLQIYDEPLADLPADEMVYHALVELLPSRQEEIITGLSADSRRVQLLCIKMAGVSGTDAAFLPLRALLADNDDDVEMVTVIVRSLAMLPEPKVMDVILPYLNHDDHTISATVMAQAGRVQHLPARDAMMAMIEGAEKSSSDNLRVGLALAQFSQFQDEQSITFLVKRIHHPDPGLRKICHEQLVTIGPPVLPALETCLGRGDKDQRIMAANLVGMIGARQGAGQSSRLLYRRSGVEANLGFALYEALGRIPSERSLITLLDGLHQSDDLLLLAVITGLEQQATERLAVPLLSCLAENEIQASLIIQTMIDSRSTRLMTMTYGDEEQGEVLIDLLLDSNDPAAIELFSKELATMTKERSVADGQRLAALNAAQLSDTHLLVADDSRALLFFYQGAAKEMGLQISTALDGCAALATLDSGSQVDLLITDMNMPNMDGIELIRKVREQPRFAELPIIMATTESEQSQKDLAREAGANGFLCKPLKREVLKEEISRILNADC